LWTRSWFSSAVAARSRAEAPLDARGLARTYRGDGLADAPEGPETVQRLQRRQHHQAKPKDTERAHERLAEDIDLLIQLLSALGHLKRQRSWLPGIFASRSTTRSFSPANSVLS
jgi:hypothetical protein